MKKGLLVCNCTLFAILCVFVFSPLRLDTDIIRLFAMALPAATGGAYGTDQFPPFYPHLLCFLMKLGWCNSVVLLTINFIALLAAMFLFYKIMQLNGCTFCESMLALAAIQLSWCVAKHVLLPQTDILLLPFFIASLFGIMRAERSIALSRKMLWFVVATIFALIAMTIRIAAIPLFAVIAIVATGITPKNVFVICNKKMFWVCVLSLVGTFAIGLLLAVKFTEFDAQGGYFRAFRAFMSRGSASEILKVIWDHLDEIMQLSANVSTARIPRLIATIGTVVMPIVFGATLIKGWSWLDWGLLLALLGYGLEIFLWPYSSARFFLPVYPIAAMLVVHFVVRLWHDRKALRLIVACYVSAFAFMGVISWGWLARQWCFGKDFYRHTSEHSLAQAYRNAYMVKIKDISQFDKTFPVFILKKFDPLHALNEGDLRMEDYVKFGMQTVP